MKLEALPIPAPPRNHGYDSADCLKNPIWPTLKAVRTVMVCSNFE